MLTPRPHSWHLPINRLRACRHLGDRHQRSSRSGVSCAHAGEAATVPAVVVVVVAAAQLAPGTTRGGGRRSRQRASRVGGAVLAAGLAVRAGDATTLDSLGLSLTELQSLGPLAQCARILNALVGSGADIDEAEMRSASSTALVALLTENLSPTAAVRTFIVEYVMEITVTELGATMRENGTGDVSVQVEDGLRSLVTAQVDQLEARARVRLGPQQLQDALHDALGIGPNGAKGAVVSTHRLLLSVGSRQRTNLAREDFLWRPAGEESSLHTTIGPRLEQLGPVPDPHADFVRLAALVYLVDRTTPRTQRGFERVSCADRARFGPGRVEREGGRRAR